MTTMDYTQYKVVTLKAFLKSKGLSQEVRKADPIARLKHYKEEQIKSMEDGTYVHPNVRRSVKVYE